MIPVHFTARSRRMARRQPTGNTNITTRTFGTIEGIILTEVIERNGVWVGTGEGQLLFAYVFQALLPTAVSSRRHSTQTHRHTDTQTHRHTSMATSPVSVERGCVGVCEMLWQWCLCVYYTSHSRRGVFECGWWVGCYIRQGEESESEEPHSNPQSVRKNRIEMWRPQWTTRLMGSSLFCVFFFLRFVLLCCVWSVVTP